jgi:hypothetical protein
VIEIIFCFETKLVQFVFDLRLLEEADLAPATWIGQNNDARVGIVQA